MNYLSKINFAIFFILIFCLSSAAQTVAVAENRSDSKNETSKPNDDNVSDRIKQLENQILLMQSQIESLKNQVNHQPQVTAEHQTAAIETKNDVKSAESAETETKTQTKQLGIDLGSVRLTPYGTIFFNAFSNNGGSNNADDPLFATLNGQGGTSASVRQTRLGMRFEGAKVGNAKLSGVVEADFFGGFPTVPIGENFGVIRLRLANAKLDWEKTSVTIGQDWMPFAPMNPNSLAAAAIPQFAAAGNNWARLPQIRVDHKLTNKLIFTGAILAPQTGDYSASSTFFLQPNSGAISKTPFFQSRLSFADKNWLGSKKAGSIGISAHYGRSRVLTGTQNNNNDIDSVGIALDWNFPLHKRIILLGETFTGRNLAGFQGGVFQNYVTDFAYRNGTNLVSGGVRAIGTNGGWIQIGFTPAILKDKLTLFGSAGIDNPHDEDLVSISRTNYRKQNNAFAFNALYKLTPQLSFGAEYRHFETLYLFGHKKTVEHINLSGAFNF